MNLAFLYQFAPAAQKVVPVLTWRVICKKSRDRAGLYLFKGKDKLFPYTPRLRQNDSFH